MLTKHTTCKHVTPCKFHFVITHHFCNGTVNSQCGLIKVKYNRCRTKPYNLNAKFKYYSSISMYHAANIWFTCNILMYSIKTWNKVYDWMQAATFDVIFIIIYLHEVFMTVYFLRNGCTFLERVTN